MARPLTGAVRFLAGSREPVRLATTSNVDIATGGLLVIDGVQTVAGDRVLLAGQTDATECGIYLASAGEWYRAADANATRSINKGVTAHVQSGDVNAGKLYRFDTLNPNIGDDNISLSEIYLSIAALMANRLRFQGYTPNYNLDDAMTEGGGSTLSAQVPFDMGVHTLPAGADQQHVGIRFIGDFTSNENFETEGARAISFRLIGRNADLYGVIGTVNLVSGAKGVKALYGRAIIESTSAPGAGDYGGVGIIGAVTLDTVGLQATSAWAAQLSIDGAQSLPVLANQRFISLSTNQASKAVGYGIFSDSPLRYSTAFIRAFWFTGVSGPFLWWQQKDGGGAGIHTDIFKVTFDGVPSAMAGIAIPAGGTAGKGYLFSSTANFGVFFGSGAPTLAAAKGSLYLRSDGSGVADRAYINTDGGTTWTALSTAA